MQHTVLPRADSLQTCKACTTLTYTQCLVHCTCLLDNRLPARLAACLAACLLACLHR
jgi:hypothetical protein